LHFGPSKIGKSTHSPSFCKIPLTSSQLPPRDPADSFFLSPDFSTPATRKCGANEIEALAPSRGSDSSYPAAPQEDCSRRWSSPSSLAPSWCSSAPRSVCVAAPNLNRLAGGCREREGEGKARQRTSGIRSRCAVLSIHGSALLLSPPRRSICAKQRRSMMPSRPPRYGRRPV
jgi:hypothetical protein